MATNEVYKYVDKEMLARFLQYLKFSFGTVKKVNGKKPDAKGNVDLDVATDVIKKIYPVGAIYITVTAVNPGSASLLNFGTWEELDGGKGGYCLTTAGGSYIAPYNLETAANRLVTTVELKGSTSAVNDHTHTVVLNTNTVGKTVPALIPVHVWVRIN